MGQIEGKNSQQPSQKSVTRKSASGNSELTRRQVKRSDLDLEFLKT